MGGFGAKVAVANGPLTLCGSQHGSECDDTRDSLLLTTLNIGGERTTRSCGITRGWFRVRVHMGVRSAAIDATRFVRENER